MTGPVGFIGDVHGEHKKLVSLVSRARDQTGHLVFLGDYINRGPDSRRVLDYLVELQADASMQTDFCRGNHDAAFLAAIQGTGMRTFLRMGGAATITEYISRPPSSHLLEHLRAAVPASHVEFLRGLKQCVVGAGYVAMHDPADAQGVAGTDQFLRVCGHRPQPERVPFVTPSEALIDTGAGTLDDGLLTCFFLPQRNWIQV